MAKCTAKNDFNTSKNENLWVPSEFMVLEAAMDSPTASTGTLRVAQRVGHAWGTVQGKKTFDCSL